MAKYKNPFKYSEKQRDKIIKNQDRQITNVYRENYKQSKELFKFVKNRNVSSESLQKVYLNGLEKQLSQNFQYVDRQVERIVTNNMNKMVNVVLENNQTYLNTIGLNDAMNIRQMRFDATNAVLNGSIYKDKNWNLSSAIWGDSKSRQREINKIIANGIVEKKSIEQIAKELQKYVNPDKINMIKIPGVRGKIDYNALRLARTTVQHSYQKAFVDATRLNPFIDAYRWITSGANNVCELCIERETSDQFGLGPGIFPKDQLPLDHPNGNCTFDIVVSMDDDEIAEAIADWYLGEGDEEMNRKLDEFANSLK
ncbi:MAG: hypothetical protein J6W71_05410 [Methanobrevibacter sp.]|nr:hypothetical protein [Methanobrevibacter sp.]